MLTLASSTYGPYGAPVNTKSRAPMISPLQILSHVHALLEEYRVLGKGTSDCGCFLFRVV